MMHDDEWAAFRAETERRRAWAAGKDDRMARFAGRLILGMLALYAVAGLVAYLVGRHA